MDISSFVTVDKSTCEIKNPTNVELTLTNDDKKKSAMTITIAGPETDLYRKAQYEMRRTLLKKYAGKDREDIDFDDTFEEVTEKSVAFLAEITIEWNITYNGEQPKYDKELGVEFYTKNRWVATQLEVFMATQANFMPDLSED